MAPDGVAPTSPQAAALAALDAADIRWAALRDDPLDNDAGDIDLLVHPDDVRRMDDVLHPIGFARLMTWRHGDHRFHIAYDETHDRWVKLDTVSRFAYRSGRQLPDRMVGSALARRTRVGGAWRLSPDDEFWALILHCLLDRGSVATRHLVRLGALAEQEPKGPLREALAVPDVAAAAVAGARAGDGATLAALRDSIGTNLARPPLGRRLWRGGLGVMTPVLKAVVRPGINVVVLGPDGSGKSTLVRSLPGTLPLPVRTYYAGLYGERMQALTSTRVPGVALASQLAVAWGAYLSSSLQRRLGRVTVFDRYGYDALLAPSGAQPSRKRRIRRGLVGGLVPRPDLILVLDAPAARLHGRKAEHDLESVEHRRAAYRQLAGKLSARAATELIDTTVERGAVRRRATALIWRAFSDRRGPTGGSAGRRRYNRASTPREGVGAHGNR